MYLYDVLKSHTCPVCDASVFAQEEGGWSVSDAATSKAGNYESEMLAGHCIPNGGGGAGDPYWDNP
jgi:hypothetical protein